MSNYFTNREIYLMEEAWNAATKGIPSDDCDNADYASLQDWLNTSVADGVCVDDILQHDANAVPDRDDKAKY